VYPDVVAVTVAALRVIAQQQVSAFVLDQGGEFRRGLARIGADETRPVGRVGIQHRPVPAVRVAQMRDPGRSQVRRAGPQFREPVASPRPGGRAHDPVGGHDDHHPVPLGGQSRQRSPGQQHLVIGMRVEGHDRRHGPSLPRVARAARLS